ncbi:HTH-type transcriptional repressor NsrR (plasmid) [Maritalea myrionectae]|uniref:HTH-type transcriptional repressor NsrR n=1 Tax=Maritalea myrionectae TaxID=454601 RepID=A0A2R4MJD3_9HYPH|nr:Rrf2 family transcriptional regulator [Maritalea myrionectae]AVX06099.1 HTH-type transcriptional repressor NsrR [Maritalea myrionectae]
MIIGDNWHLKYQFDSGSTNLKLTSFTDYGLRISMLIAGSPNRVFSTTELADFLSLPKNHLSKIIQTLVRGKILVSKRGHGGGISLSMPPEEIKLGDLIKILEQKQSLVECFSPNKSNCTIEHLCRLKVRLSRAEEKFLEDLNRSTLQDIAIENILNEKNWKGKINDKIVEHS